MSTVFIMLSNFLINAFISNVNGRLTWPIGIVANKTDSQMEGIIKMVISNVNELKHVKSPICIVADLPWRLEAQTECSKRTNYVNHLALYLSCNGDSQSARWSCEADASLKLVNQNKETTSLTMRFTSKFNFNRGTEGYPKFLEWAAFVNPETGYVKDNKAMAEASIVIKNVSGIRRSPAFDFKTPQGRASDGVLVLEGTRVHINKDYLAMHSPVFAAKFYGKSREKKRIGNPLNEVKLEQFIELLRVVYPSQKPVNADNVEFLLKLGDKFDMKLVVDACERFLIGTEEFDVITKLVWAGQYQLVALEDVCLGTFKSIHEIKKLKKMTKYDDLSDTIKISLLEKMFKLMKSRAYY